MSYKTASTINHKMANKYQPPSIEEDTFTIHNGSIDKWVNMTKQQLLQEIPWVNELISTPGAMLFIDDVLGFPVHHITDAGAFHYIYNPDTPWQRKGIFYIAKHPSRPNRYFLKDMAKDSDGIWRYCDYHSRIISSATVSTNYASFLFSPGTKRYKY
jgi:hypothetical protein